MQFTVGIVTCERPSSLERTLESLLAQSRPVDELVVVDDSTSNETERVVDRFRKPFTELGTDFIYVHRSDSPDDGTGMTDARNDVLDEATGDVICYIDDDVVCPTDWLLAYESAYHEFPNAAVIGGPSLDVTNPQDDVDENTSLVNQNRLNRYGECKFNDMYWMPPDPVRTHHLRGANMSFRKSVLEDIGGFNPIYRGRNFYEETDVMARLWKQGEKTIYHPDVFLYHINTKDGEAVTFLNFDDPEVWYWAARNSIVFRYHVFPETFWIGIVRTLIYTKNWPGPVLKILGGHLFTRDRRFLQALSGYVDGFRQVLDFN